MTRKHFQDLAYALMESRPKDGENLADRVAAWETTVAAVADACRRHNSNFDRGRFMAAANADNYTPSMHGR